MFDPTQRSRLRGFRPLVRGGAENTSITGRVGFRNNPIMDPNYTDPSTPQFGGRHNCRTNARFQRIELTVAGEWTEAFGVMVESKDLGPGGRRG